MPALTPEQAGDVAFIERRLIENKKPGVLLTNQTGTGKTFSGMGAVKRALDRGEKHVLVLAPSDKIGSDWVATAKEHFATPDIAQLDSTSSNGKENRVVVTTYANLRANNELVNRPWGMVVADEAQYLSQAQDGKETGALDAFRALTFHPRGLRSRAEMMEPDAVSRRRELYDQGSKNKFDFSAKDKAEMDRLSAKIDAAYDLVAKQAKEQERPKALMLSATPFAYHFSLDYGEGYLFDYPPEPKDRGYNTPSARSQFYIENFGYRMRTGKLTQPENATATNILERRFAEKLMKDGAMSGRALEVPHDYSRDFVITRNPIGDKIDEIMKLVSEKAEFRPLQKYLGINDYLQRRYLLEALKARDAVERIQQHLALGRKVVVFHDYKKGGGMNPLRPQGMSGAEVMVYDPETSRSKLVNLDQAYAKLRETVPGFDQLLADLDGLQSPIDVFTKAFPDAGIFNGSVPKAKRRQIVNEFNQSGGKMNVVLVQRASGKEGISLHDRDGQQQRVFIDLGIPSRPTDAIQSEGRIYRHGVQSNAAMEYLTTGTNFERWTFAQTIAQRASTAENLAMGERARALLQSFANGYNDAEFITPHAGQGIGGKAKDHARDNGNPYRNAVALYYTNQKKTARNKSSEGVDYFATPEPLGFKMVEWAGIRPGEKVLEPSAGHGAIARFFPDSTNRHAVEPSNELAGRLALNATDTEIHQERFEDYHISNKFDAIVMNAPFGTGGKTAMEHSAKAALHLRDGGRLVTLIPMGGSMEKRFDAWINSPEARNMHIRAEILLPASTFERAGTGVSARVVVLDKFTNENNTAPGENWHRDLTSAGDTKEFFDKLENISVPTRPEKAAPVEKPATPEVAKAGFAAAKKAVGLSTAARDVFDSAKAAPDEFTGVNASHLSAEDRRAVAKSGLSLTEDRQRNVIATYPQRLRAEDLRQKVLSNREETNAVANPSLPTPTRDSTYSPADFIHTKTGEPVFVAKIERNLARDEFLAAKARAVANRGSYSGYNKDGAIRGFIFKSAEARDAFIGGHDPNKLAAPTPRSNSPEVPDDNRAARAESKGTSPQSSQEARDATDLPLDRQGRTLYEQANKAGMTVPPRSELLKALTETRHRTLDRTEHELAGIIWRMERESIHQRPYAEDFAHGQYLIQMWQALRAPSRERALRVASALDTLARGIKEPNTYYDPWANTQELLNSDSLRKAQAAYIGELVPNDVRERLGDEVAERAQRLEMTLANALARGTVPTLNDLWSVANPQHGDIEAGGEFGDAVADAAIHDAARRLVENQDHFDSIYAQTREMIKVARVEEALNDKIAAEGIDFLSQFEPENQAKIEAWRREIESSLSPEFRAPITGALNAPVPREVTARALAELPVKERQAVVGRLSEKKSDAELARQLGLSETGVENAFRTGMAKLKAARQLNAPVPRRTIEQEATDKLKATGKGPKSPRSEVFFASKAIKDSALSGWQKAVEVAKNTGNALGRFLTELPKVSDYKAAKGEWLGAGNADATHATGRQQASHEARLMSKAIDKNFTRESQEAVSRFIEAGGDLAKLSTQAATSKANKAVYAHAANLTPAEKELAKQAREFFADKGKQAQDAGVLGELLENYVSHFVDQSSLPAAKKTAALDQLRGTIATSKLKTRFDHALQRVFDSMHDLENAGYKLHTGKVGDIMAAYSQAYNNVMADRTFVKLLTTLKAEDGRPIAVTSGYAKPIGDEEPPAALMVKPHGKPDEATDYLPIDHPALRKWKWANTDENGKQTFVEGDLLIHPDVYDDLKNTLGKSALMNVPIVRAATNLQYAVKQTMLSLSGFHFVQEGTHAIGHGVNPFKLVNIDFSNPLHRDLVNRGLMVSAWDAKREFSEGLAGTGLLGKVPWLGRINDEMGSFLFEDYIPRLKMTMATHAFARNMERWKDDLASGKITRDEVLQKTAQQANDAFGEQNYKYMGSNPTFLHALNLTFLAPDFLKSRGKFFADAFTKYGGEQRRALFILAVTMMVTAKLVERALTGKNRWDKPFAVVTPTRQYELRSVPGDVMELLQDPRRFINGRISPLVGRTALEGITGRDYRGLKRGLWEQIADGITTAIPISLRGVVHPKEISPLESVVSATGARIKRNSAMMEARKLGSAWQVKQGIQNPDESFPPSKYLGLKEALQDGDMHSAKKSFDALVKEHGRDKVVRGFTQSVSRPFSGSAAHEQAFARSLSSSERETLREGKAEQARIMAAFHRVAGGDLVASR